MNAIADALEPYFKACGILYKRNKPNMSLGEIIADSNAGEYDLHYALHSNASAGGNVRGCHIYYYTYSNKGRAAAEYFCNAYKGFYPDANKVQAIPNAAYAEVKKTKAVAIIDEVAFHDQAEDAKWIHANIERIAEHKAKTLCAYLKVPFIDPKAGTAKGEALCSVAAMLENAAKELRELSKD